MTNFRVRIGRMVSNQRSLTEAQGYAKRMAEALGITPCIQQRVNGRWENIND